MGDDHKINEQEDFSLRDRPEEWPAVWRDARAHSEKAMPEHLDAVVLGAMRDALDKSNVGESSDSSTNSVPGHSRTRKAKLFRFPRVAWMAAAATIPLALGAYILFQTNRESPGPLRIVDSRGPVVHKSHQGETDAVSNPRTGHRLELGHGARVFLRFENNLAMRLDGPGRFELRRVDAAERALHIAIQRGSIAVHGEGRANGRDIAWITSRTNYRMIGTTAGLTVNAAGERLLVGKGAFRVETENGSSHDVGEGRVLKIAATGNPRPEISALTERARREVDDLRNDLIKRVPPVASRSVPTGNPDPDKTKKENKPNTNRATGRKNAGERPRSPVSRRRKVFTIDQLRDKYGSLHLIRLKNGRKIVGHMRFQGDSILIMTEYGPLRIKRSRMSGAEEY